MRPIRNVPLVLAALYLLYFAANGAYVFYRSEFAPESGEFAAFGIILLTLPWSLYLEPILGGGPDSTTFGVVARFALYGLVNAAIVYAACALLMRLAGASRKPAT